MVLSLAGVCTFSFFSAFLLRSSSIIPLYLPAYPYPPLFPPNGHACMNAAG